MGTSFRWLVGSSWTSNLGDGISLAAGPLLVASQTDDPLLVALGALLQRLPWLLFGLHAGVLADRVDRRLLVLAVSAARTAVLVVLAAALAFDAVDVVAVLVAMFLLGTAEVFTDTTTGTLLPMVVLRADLGVGNARLMAGHLTMGEMAGPAAGAALFALGSAWPFPAEAVLAPLGALFGGRMALSAVPPSDPPPCLRRDVAGGMRGTWGNRAVRTLTLAIVTFNVTGGAAWSVLVLYADRRLALGPAGFGLPFTASAAGGVLGTASYDWLERRAG